MSTVLPLGEILDLIQKQKGVITPLRKQAKQQSRLDHILDRAYGVLNHLVVDLLEQHYNALVVERESNRKFGKVSPHILVVGYQNFRIRVDVSQIEEINSEVVSRIRHDFIQKQGESPRFGFSGSDRRYVIAKDHLVKDSHLIFDREFWRELDDYYFDPVDIREVVKYVVPEIARPYPDRNFPFRHDKKWYFCTERSFERLPTGTLWGDTGKFWSILTKMNDFEYYSTLMGKDAQQALRDLVLRYDGEKSHIQEDSALPSYSGVMWLEPALPQKPFLPNRTIRALLGENHTFLGLIEGKRSLVYSDTLCRCPTGNRIDEYFIPTTPLMTELWEASRLSEIVAANFVSGLDS